MDHGTLVASLQARATAVLAPLLAGLDRFALIDFPHYANVGDSAIFLGQLACLRALGVPEPSYVCDLRSYDAAMLARQLGDGTILLAGGGGFGDLWPVAQRLREEIAVRFRRNRIVQLPQSIHFQDRAALERARRTFESHLDFTLLAREDRSLEIARRHFGLPTRLCPDMALFLGLLPRPVAPSRPLTWLARTDKEATGDPWPADAAGIRTDWLEEPESVLRGLTDRLIDLVRRHPRSSVLRRCLSRIYTPVARARLRRGCSILSRGRVVITDRLHGHILSVLLGIPHVVHDNTYGKLSSFHRTWTSDGELVRWAGSKAEALRIAQEVLEEERTRADGAAHPSAQGGSGT